MTRSLYCARCVALCAVALGALLVWGGCGDDNASQTANTNGATTSTPNASGAPDCFENPTTHVEIINACTDATSVAKVPITPLLNADGSLPPLP